MSTPAVLLASEDGLWLAAAGEAVVRSGGVVVAECPDVVSLLAYASLDLADTVLVDSRTVTLDRAALIALRRRGLGVATVAGGERGAGRLVAFEAALTPTRVAEVTVGHPVLAIVGSKGAPGATRLAIATARRVAENRRTALIELDPRGGDIAAYLEVAEDASVLLAMEALASDASWSFSCHRGGLAVLVAPSRPTWSADAVPADVGLLIDTVRQERCVIVDAGAVGSSVDPIGLEVLRRATHTVLVGRGDRVGLVRLRQARAVLQRHARDVIVMTDTWRAADLAALLGAEQQHQAGRGVEQHHDRHRNARRGALLLGNLRRRHQRDGPIVGSHRSEHVADHDHDHLQ